MEKIELCSHKKENKNKIQMRTKEYLDQTKGRSI